MYEIAQLFGTLDLPGSNDVGAHAARTLLDGNDLRERVDTGLGGRNVRLERHTLVVEGGRDVQVRALGLADIRQGGLEGVVRAELAVSAGSKCLRTARGLHSQCQSQGRCGRRSPRARQWARGSCRRHLALALDTLLLSSA